MKRPGGGQQRVGVMSIRDLRNEVREAVTRSDAVEIFVNCVVPEFAKPDYLLIDLDPSEGNPWEHVREIAMVVKEVLDELKVPSFPKTSGVSGMHVLTPIVPELPFPEVRRLAKAPLGS